MIGETKAMITINKMTEEIHRLDPKDPKMKEEVEDVDADAEEEEIASNAIKKAIWQEIVLILISVEVTEDEVEVVLVQEVVEHVLNAEKRAIFLGNVQIKTRREMEETEVEVVEEAVEEEKARIVTSANKAVISQEIALMSKKEETDHTRDKEEMMAAQLEEMMITMIGRPTTMTTMAIEVTITGLLVMTMGKMHGLKIRTLDPNGQPIHSNRTALTTMEDGEIKMLALTKDGDNQPKWLINDKSQLD